jgi:subtilisin family serine protease
VRQSLTSRSAAATGWIWQPWDEHTVSRAGGGYSEENGTSEAAPFVSALAGLLASEGKTASEIRQRMQPTATDLGLAGDDPNFGQGRIDANRAVP